MGYGYFLSEVFKYINIPLSVGKVGTVKQAFSENTLVGCECIEWKGNPKSKMSQLIEDQDQLKHEVEELTMGLSGKDAEIAILKAELLTAQTEGPGTSVVQEKAIKNTDAANDRLTLIIQSLSHHHPPSQSVPIVLCVFLVWLVFLSLDSQFAIIVLNVILECYLSYSPGVLAIIYCECFPLCLIVIKL